MANEERMPEWEEDPEAGEISLEPIQVETSQGDSSVGSSSSASNDEHVASFVEMQPKFRVLQRQIRDYANAHKPASTTSTSSTAPAYKKTPSTYKPAPTKPSPPPQYKPAPKKGYSYAKKKTGGDVFCFLATLLLFLVSMFGFAVNPYTGETVMLPAFIMGDGEMLESPILLLFEVLEDFDEGFSYIGRAIALGVIGISALVFCIQLIVYTIRCFSALCKGESEKVRTSAMFLLRKALYQYVIFAMFGFILGYDYSLLSVCISPVFTGGLLVSLIVYFIVAVCTSPSRNDVMAVIGNGLILYVLSAGGLLSYATNRVFIDLVNFFETGSEETLMVFLMLDALMFIITCVFANRSRKALMSSMKTMNDCSSASYTESEKYLTFVPMIVWSAVMTGVVITNVMIWDEVGYLGGSPATMILSFFIILVISIISQIIGRAGRRR